MTAHGHETVAVGRIDGTFFTQSAQATTARCLYFSFATLTTVGYGDVAPASGPARSLSIAEAVVGQFYLAVLIADLIGKRVSGGVKRS